MRILIAMAFIGAMLGGGFNNCSLGAPQTNLVTEQELAREALRTGDYGRCIQIAKEQVEKRVWNERWPAILLDAYLTTGQYDSAVALLDDTLQRFGDSLRIRMLAYRVYQFSNQATKAAEQLDTIDQLIQRTPWRYTSSSELVPLGEYFLLRGEDPKQVLKACFDQALKSDPKSIEAHLATARMALDKNDAKVASQSLTKAMKIDENSPEIHYLSARAWSSSQPEVANEHLKSSLKINPKYVPSLLFVAEDKMNDESYEQALDILNEVEAVHAKLPKLWALRAAIAHLQGKYEEEGKARAKAMETWPLNPEVDHTIGKHLGMHYRFTESVEYQRRALKMDPEYTPAQSQLAQDLLRLGQNEDGWKIVEDVRINDPYDVTIYNLKQLQKELDRFATLEAPGFVVRMDAKESRIYGTEVLSLLSEARETLTKKYEVTLEEPIYVEIFPKQKDFAIRTFGLPGGAGFLGVCFGRLITANSPAALQVDSNWKSVLWHEYCHVVTLQKTKNRMPRWLSEGISVYEEKLRDSAWGQHMDPTYRRMILGPDLFPVSKLSSAFLHAKSPMHLQFAYFESSIAVEFFIEKYGMKAMHKLLDDLATGMPMNDALRRAPGTLEALDQEFEAYIHAQANSLAPDADWEEPPKGDRAALEVWYTEHPNALATLEHRMTQAIREKDWERAEKVGQAWKETWPEDHRTNGVYAALGLVAREQNQPDKERESLVEWVRRSSDAIDALNRLVILDSAAERWDDVAQWNESISAIQPLRYEVQERRATIAEKTENWSIAEVAWKACLELDPLDVAWVHYRIATALEHQNNPNAAREHILKTLEESPRFVEALKLLVRLQPRDESVPSQSGESESPVQTDAVKTESTEPEGSELGSTPTKTPESKPQ